MDFLVCLVSVFLDVGGDLICFAVVADLDQDSRVKTIGVVSVPFLKTSGCMWGNPHELIEVIPVTSVSKKTVVCFFVLVVELIFLDFFGDFVSI